MDLQKHPSVPLTPLALARLAYASDSQRALACTFKGSFPFPAQRRGPTRAKLHTTRHTGPVFSFTPTRQYNLFRTLRFAKQAALPPPPPGGGMGFWDYRLGFELTFPSPPVYQTIL